VCHFAACTLSAGWGHHTPRCVHNARPPPARRAPRGVACARRERPQGGETLRVPQFRTTPSSFIFLQACRRRQPGRMNSGISAFLAPLPVPGESAALLAARRPHAACSVQQTARPAGRAPPPPQAAAQPRRCVQHGLSRCGEASLGTLGWVKSHHAARTTPGPRLRGAPRAGWRAHAASGPKEAKPCACHNFAQHLPLSFFCRLVGGDSQAE
jgi:hypothetical protein